MTREEAIYEIKQLAVLSNKKNIDRITEALEMAIEALADRKTENSSEKPNKSTRSKMEQVDKPQTCDTCKYGEDKHRYAHICNECGVGINNYEPKDEPQTDCAWK